MTRLVLVRHGETVWHAENRYAGSSDVALTARGEAQALALARWAKGAELTRIYASPLGRARATAQAAAEALGLPLQIDPRLRELSFGQAEGLTAGELKTRFPAEYAAFVRDPVAHPLPQGEDPRAAIARARDAVADIVAEAPGERVLAVAHSTLLRLLLCDLLGLDPARYREIFPRFDNVALTEVRLTSHQPAAMLCFNAPISLNPPGTSEEIPHAK